MKPLPNKRVQQLRALGRLLSQREWPYILKVVVVTLLLSGFYLAAGAAVGIDPLVAIVTALLMG